MKIKSILFTAVVSAAVLYFSRQSEEKQDLIASYVQVNDSLVTLHMEDLADYSTDDLVSVIGVLNDTVSGMTADLFLVKEGQGSFSILTKTERSFAKGSIETMRHLANERLKVVLDELKSRL